MPNPDLVAEHEALEAELAELRKLCLEEWPIMSAEEARARLDRLLAIRDRLATIERTTAWSYRD